MRIVTFDLMIQLCHHEWIFWILSRIHSLMPIFCLYLKFLNCKQKILCSDKVSGMTLKIRKEREVRSCRGIKSVYWLGSRITASSIWYLRTKLWRQVFFWLTKEQSLWSAWYVLSYSRSCRTHTSIESLLSRLQLILNFSLFVQVQSLDKCSVSNYKSTRIGLICIFEYCLQSWKFVKHFLFAIVI